MGTKVCFIAEYFLPDIDKLEEKHKWKLLYI